MMKCSINVSFYDENDDRDDDYDNDGNDGNDNDDSIKLVFQQEKGNVQEEFNKGTSQRSEVA